MSVHLATLDGILCSTAVNTPARSVLLESVSCLRCAKRLDEVSYNETDAAFTRSRLNGYALAAEALDVPHLWDLVANADSPSERLIRDILGAVLVGLFESQASA